MFRRATTTLIGLGLCFAPTLSAQAAAPSTAAYGHSLSGKTHVERAIGKCVASMFIGGLLGAAVGAATGNTGRGAAIGLAGGAAVCALLIGAATEKDKAALRNAQLEALNSGRLQTLAWQTDQGQSVQATVQPSKPGSLILTSNGSLECRRDDTCRVGDSWYPKSQILAGNAAPDAPKLVKASFSSAQQLVCRKSHVAMNVASQSAANGDDMACLVGDVWVTGDQLKKRKINEDHVLI